MGTHSYGNAAFKDAGYVFSVTGDLVTGRNTGLSLGDMNTQSIFIQMDGNFEEGVREPWQDTDAVRSDRSDWTNSDGLNLWLGTSYDTAFRAEIGSHLTAGRGQNDIATLLTNLVGDPDRYGDNVQMQILGADAVAIGITNNKGVTDFINVRGNYVSDLLEEAGFEATSGFQIRRDDFVFVDYAAASVGSKGVKFFYGDPSTQPGDFAEVWGNPIDINPLAPGEPTNAPNKDAVKDGLEAWYAGEITRAGSDVRIFDDGKDGTSTVVFNIPGSDRTDRYQDHDVLTVTNVPDSIILMAQSQDLLIG